MPENVPESVERSRHVDVEDDGGNGSVFRELDGSISVDSEAQLVSHPGVTRHILNCDPVLGPVHEEVGIFWKRLPVD